MAGLFIKKDLAKLISDANDPLAGEAVHGAHAGGQLKRTLTAFNLTMLGIGAIIGAGIFSLTGTASAHYAGPGIVYSFMIGGVLCALAGVCYAEMASMIPVAGSAYAYSYATMGEFIAWIIGWDLILEYAFGSVTVSASWSGYFLSLMHKTLGIPVSDTLLRFTKGPWEQVLLNDGVTQAYGLWNIPASVIGVVVASILYRGMRESAWVNNLIVVVKVSIVLVFIGLGISLISPDNLFVNSAATGLAALVPAKEMITLNGNQVNAYGWGLNGVLTGAGVVFFAYIGFDAVSTTAQEAKNPKRDLPIGILGSLVICTILYILVALTLTGVVPYKELGVPDPIAVGIDRIVELRGWSAVAQTVFTFFIKLGALAGLTSVILVMMMGQTRIFYAMSKDGLLPWFGAVHKEHGTPYVATVVTGLFVGVCGGLMPMSLVGELVSIGTLLAFVLVCIGVPILRVANPTIERPFKVPGGMIGAWVVGIAGALACLYVMWGLPKDTWLRLIIWLEIGLAIYGIFGWRHSRLADPKSTPARASVHKLILGDGHRGVHPDDVVRVPGLRNGAVGRAVRHREGHMAARILDGTATGAAIRAELAPRVAAFQARAGRPPGLGIVLAGHDPGSEIYVRNKLKTAGDAGIRAELIRVAAEAPVGEVLATVAALNGRDDIDGILVQSPLPAGMGDDAETRVLDAIDPAKDVDGFTPANVGLLVQNRPCLTACTPSGVIELLERSGIAISGARAVVIGRSDIVGKPMALLLLHRHATVTICHSRTRDLPAVARTADILVAAIGRPAFVTPDFVKPGRGGDRRGHQPGVRRSEGPGVVPARLSAAGRVCQTRQNHGRGRASRRRRSGRRDDAGAGRRGPADDRDAARQHRAGRRGPARGLTADAEGGGHRRHRHRQERRAGPVGRVRGPGGRRRRRGP